MTFGLLLGPQGSWGQDRQCNSDLFGGTIGPFIAFSSAIFSKAIWQYTIWAGFFSLFQKDLQWNAKK
jgi:hypothetical protein